MHVGTPYKLRPYGKTPILGCQVGYTTRVMPGEQPGTRSDCCVAQMRYGKRAYGVGAAKA